MIGVVDTDVVYKCSVYKILTLFCENPPAEVNCLAILAATKFVATKKISKKLPPDLAQFAADNLQHSLEYLEEIEPTEAESELASTLEYIASTSNLNLDCGESQLCAIVLSRGYDMIFTGDKRAIFAMEELNNNELVGGKLSSKVYCFEKIVLALLDIISMEKMRAQICAHAGTDRAIEACFSCKSESTSHSNVQQGLKSYIGHICARAPTVIYKT